MLDALLHPPRAEADLVAWRTRATFLAGAIGWDATFSERRHADRAALALTAPKDALVSATLINEWAWMVVAVDGAARAAATVEAGEELLPLDEASAIRRLRERLAEEANPGLMALDVRATREGVPLLFDDESVSVGYGTRSRTWPLRDLPAADQVDWRAIGEIPVALVTGSNGKTTTVRLVAAMLERAGHCVGFCCSDGVFVGGERVQRGDWSGPAGARLVLRDPRVTAAVIEAARGGLLRRGLAVPMAHAAIVTNVAEDHLGGYGISSLSDLAAVKLVVARALGATGTLVLPADDVTLRATPHRHDGRVEWFDLATPPANVPPVAELPLALGGAARHNVANAIGAAHVARALGVPDDDVRDTLRTFGADNRDNPGRLERFDRGGVRVWVDYAHNPHGLRALLTAASTALAGGRMGLLLGQAGDRDDDAVRALARAAWEARPARIVLKDLDGYLRGRASGEVPALLRAELLAAGADAARISIATDETAGVRALLDWAAPGDLLVLPVHALDARERAVALIRDPSPPLPSGNG